METLFTAPQTIVIGGLCLFGGIIIGALWVLHIGGGMLPWSKE